MVCCLMKTCCCLPLKKGLEVFGYIKILICYTTLLFLTGGFYAQYQNTGKIEVPLVPLLILCYCAVNFIMSGLHLYSLRKDNLLLVYLYFYYTILLLLVEMVIGLLVYLWQVLRLESDLYVLDDWILVGTLVLVCTAIAIHILLAFGVYSYGVVLRNRRRKQELLAKTGMELLPIRKSLYNRK